MQLVTFYQLFQYETPPIKKHGKFNTAARITHEITWISNLLIQWDLVNKKFIFSKLEWKGVGILDLN